MGIALVCLLVGMTSATENSRDRKLISIAEEDQTLRKTRLKAPKPEGHDVDPATSVYEPGYPRYPYKTRNPVGYFPDDGSGTHHKWRNAKFSGYTKGDKCFIIITSHGYSESKTVLRKDIRPYFKNGDHVQIRD